MPERSEFTVRVHDEGDGNGLWAEVVELPGCFASGDTEDELREALVEAIELYVGKRIGRIEWSDSTDVVEEHRILVAAG